MSGIPSCSENTRRLTASLYRMRIFMFSVYRSKKKRPHNISLTTCNARLQRLTPSPDPGILGNGGVAAAGDADQLGHRDRPGTTRRGARRGIPPERSANRIRTD